MHVVQICSALSVAADSWQIVGFSYQARVQAAELRAEGRGHLRVRHYLCRMFLLPFAAQTPPFLAVSQVPDEARPTRCGGGPGHRAAEGGGHQGAPAEGLVRRGTAFLLCSHRILLECAAFLLYFRCLSSLIRCLSSVLPLPF